MSELKPNKCICGHGLPHTNKLLDRWQSICGHCGRAGQRSFKLDEAIADWNRQTAAPNLLEALKAVKQFLHEVYCKHHEDAIYGAACLKQIDAAIANAEPKG